MYKKPRHFLHIVAIAALFPFAAHAQEAEPAGVVELFTSQGCNSCPPADAALEKLAARGDVIALGYHVDYWDYLGWDDTLGSAENSQRQYDYAKSLKRRGVYTPQAVINGRTHTNGAHLREIVGTLKSFEQSGKGLPADVDLHQMGDRVRVSVAGSTAGGGKAHIVVVYYKRASKVPIERGENAGKTLTYVNAVVDYQTIGMWDGEEMTVDIPETELGAHDADGCAVLLQTTAEGGHPGPIIGAAILPRRDG